MSCNIKPSHKAMCGDVCCYECNDGHICFRDNSGCGYFRDLKFSFKKGNHKECCNYIKEGKELDKSEVHAEICIELNKIYVKKNNDYGDSFSKSYDEFGMAMPCIRLDDKLNRLKSLTKGKDQQVKDESIKDTLLDLANYAIMTIIEMER